MITIGAADAGACDAGRAAQLSAQSPGERWCPEGALRSPQWFIAAIADGADRGVAPALPLMPNGISTKAIRVSSFHAEAVMPVPLGLRGGGSMFGSAQWHAFNSRLRSQ